MKAKIMFVMLALILFAAQGSSQKTKMTNYRQSDIKGMWVASFVYDEHAKDWVSVPASEIGCFAFSDVKNNGKPIAIMNNGNGVVRFSYVLTNNTIHMYDIENHSLELITIKMVSMSRGINFVGVMQTYNGTHKAKVKFLYLGDGSDD